MNTVVFPEDVANAVQLFYLRNRKDNMATDLIIELGAELLDISPDEMLEMIE